MNSKLTNNDLAIQDVFKCILELLSTVMIIDYYSRILCIIRRVTNRVRCCCVELGDVDIDIDRCISDIASEKCV